MPRTFQEFLISNQSKTCRAPGCDNPRKRISGFCHPCGVLFNKWGSPSHDFRNFRRRNYVYEVEETTVIINHNLDVVSPPHPLISRCVQKLDEMLLRVSRGVPLRAFSERDTRILLGRIADNGITGRQILIEAAALWMLWHNRPGVFATDPRDSLTHWKVVCGNQVLRLIPLNRCNILKRINLEVGAFVHKTTGPALASVNRAAQKREAMIQRRASENSKPLEVPIP